MRLHVVHGYDKHSLMTLNQSDHAYTNARERDDGGLRGNVNDVCNLRGTHGLLVDVITWKVCVTTQNTRRWSFKAQRVVATV